MYSADLYNFSLIIMNIVSNSEDFHVKMFQYEIMFNSVGIILMP